MAWTDADLKILAAGMAIGGKWNSTKGSLPRVKSTVPSGTYWYTQYFTLYCDNPSAKIFHCIGDTASFTEYDGSAIYIGETMTCYAYAQYKQGLSVISKFVYVVDNPLAGLTDTLQVSQALDMTDGVVISTATHALSLLDSVPTSPLTITDSVEINIG